MKAIILNLRAPLRSWGAASIGDDRWTEMRPTASAVIGLVGACVGLRRQDTDLSDAWFSAWDVITASAVDWTLNRQRLRPDICSDFQTASDSLKRDGTTNPHPVVSLRGYVENARDSVAVILRPDADSALFDMAAAGLRNPVFTPYLGRRCNPLSEPPLRPGGVVDLAGADSIADKLLEALRTPGLMENDVTIHEVELTSNARVLTLWVRRQRNLGHQVTQMRQGITDDRLNSAMTYAMRPVDVIRVKLASEELAA